MTVASPTQNSQGECLRPTLRWQRRLQILLGLLWLFDGILQFQPAMFRPDFFGMVLNMGPAVPPAWLGDLDGRLEPLLTAHSWGANSIFASLQILLGVGLLVRETVRVALAASVVWALAVWLFGEAAGGIFTEGASALTGAPGAALVYALLALLVWPRRSPVESAGCAADQGILPRPLPYWCWTALWVGTALLETESLNLRPRAASDAIANNNLGGPSWLVSVGHELGRIVGVHGTLFAISVGMVQALIGLGVLTSRTRRPALAAGVVTTVFYGIFGQGFGGIFHSGLLGIFHSGATDPNTAPVVVLLGWVLWPVSVTAPTRGMWGTRPGGPKSVLAHLAASARRPLESALNSSIGICKPVTEFDMGLAQARVVPR